MERERTLEELSHCPICGHAGEKGPVFNLMDPVTGKATGKKSHIFQCKNKLCRWFENGSWQIQVNPDGTIPMLSPADTNPLNIPAAPSAYEQELAQKALRELDPNWGQS